MKGKQLPGAIQHVYNDLVEGGKPTGGMTYRLAVGIVRNWAQGHDGKGNKVNSAVQAKAVKAMAEWEKLRGQAHADNVKELDGDTLTAIAELASRGALEEKVQARRRTGQYHRVTKGVESQVKSHDDLMGEIAACGHAGSGA